MRKSTKGCDFRDSKNWSPSFVSWAAVTSSVCDLGKWNRAFGTGSLLSPQMRGETTAPANGGLGGQYRGRVFRARDAGVSAMDRAAGIVLGRVYDHRLRSHDGNVIGGNRLVEPRNAAGHSAGQRNHHRDLEAPAARPPGPQVALAHGIAADPRTVIRWSPRAGPLRATARTTWSCACRGRYLLNASD